MSAIQERSIVTLPRLPPELVEMILVYAGVAACAALCNMRVLRRVLAAYVRAGNYSNDREKAMLEALVDCHWSAGVQAMIDADIRHPFCRAAELDWSGIVLPVSSIRRLYLWCLAANRRDHAPELLSILTYNRIKAGADCSDLLQWGAQQVPDFLSELSSQYIKHGRNLDQLRALHQGLGVYLHERDLARTLLPIAAQHGRLELVQALNGINPEILQEHSKAIQLAAENGHLDVVQYTHPQLQSAVPVQVLEAALLHGHEQVARWLYERCPLAVSWRAALGLAHGGHVDLLELLQSNRHIHPIEPDRYWRSQWQDSSSPIAAAAQDARVLQILKHIEPEFSVIDAFGGSAARIYLPTLQHVIRNESPTPDLQVFCAAACAGRTDIVDWMLCECPLWTSAEAIRFAAGAGHQELARRLSDHFAVPLMKCCLQMRHLRALVESGHLRKLKWIEEHCEISCDFSLLLSGIKSRNLAIAQLLHRHCQQLQFSKEMLTVACGTGNLRMVQWVYQHLPASGKAGFAIDVAAERGFERIVTWLTQHTNLPCTTHAMDSAARIGRLTIVRFLNDHQTEGCTPGAMTSAVCAGHLDVAEYLRLNRKEGCTLDTLELAVAHSTLASIQWVVEHYPEQITEKALNLAAGLSRTSVIEYFHALPDAPFSPATMDRAAASGNLDLVRWFHKNRKEGCTAEAMWDATTRGSLSIVEFLGQSGYPIDKWRDIKHHPGRIQLWCPIIKPKGSLSSQ
ncbi:hypothetical protein RI367_007000 [Sorochytrium milnesiophthora]